ncbi:tRNA-uridine aminocarboxypropyltransferase [Vibrio nitrifigilis]|uniref:tRNA-uridine aminocarboxypropyltransferase n=1 Tax=Vibrio nitrifigilis TaxID=2789781 RepID=A0ABS0GB63_9VIBR|nr:DTW domain-containing protein [Vibrio nitrifigilis]MBF8999639.1 DTW domain-containing protein [Vibrio nitrifigilis]
MSRYCSQCGKALKVCICSSIESIQTDVELIILQHPTEEHRPMGSARILSLSLPNSQCFVGEDFREHHELQQLLNEDGVDHYVLYPSDVSVVATEIMSVSGDTKKTRVILLDGTWKKAFKMWQINTQLHHLPCLHLPKELSGNYRIRKAPSENALSTVEAGYHVLSLIEPERDFTPLVRAFEQMIDTQIRHMPPGVFERNYLQ